MGECVPYYEPGAAITATCEDAVTAGRFVHISDPKEGPVDNALSSTTEGQNIVVSHATAGGTAIGVSAFDGAIGAKIGVYTAPGIVVPIIADGAITAGDLIEVGTAGKAKLANTGKVVGVALDTAADGAVAMIKTRT